MARIAGLFCHYQTFAETEREKVILFNFRSDPKDWPRVKNPYRGFLGQYRKKGDPPNINRKKGGVLWAEQIINGVRDDEPYQIGEALTCKWANVNQEVKGGLYGVPYSFSRASFFLMGLYHL